MTSEHATRGVTVATVLVTVLTYVAAVAAMATVLPVLDATGRLTSEEVVNTLGFGTAFLGLPAVGAVLAVHRPRNPIGRTLLGFAAGLYLMILAGGLIDFLALRTGAVAAPLLWFAVVLQACSPGVITLGVHLLLLFPNGVLDRGARLLWRVCLAVTAAVVGVRAVRPGSLDSAVGLENPFGQAWAEPLGAAVGPLTLALVLLGVAALVRLVARFRRADLAERAQFRWILLSLSVIPVLFSIAIATDLAFGNQTATTYIIIGGYNLGVLGFALALYRAVTKQDLYGIGRVVSRSVSYLLVVAVLAGAYLGLVVGLGAAARAATGESSDLVVAMSTLVVAALFRPVRVRARSIVDRRFNRATYDAARTIDAFGRELRDEVSLDAVVARLTDVSRGSFQPSVAGVLLVPGRKP